MKLNRPIAAAVLAAALVPAAHADSFITFEFSQEGLGVNGDTTFGAVLDPLALTLEFTTDTDWFGAGPGLGFGSELSTSLMFNLLGQEVSFGVGKTLTNAFDENDDFFGEVNSDFEVAFNPTDGVSSSKSLFFGATRDAAPGTQTIGVSFDVYEFQSGQGFTGGALGALGMVAP